MPSDLVIAAQTVEHFFGDAIVWLSGLTALEFVRAFWAFIFFELPRYAVTNLAVLTRHLMGRIKAAPGALDSEPTERVSVIVPAYNEAATIADTVRSLLEQDYPRIDIVVVDDGSTDGTAAVMRDIINRYGPTVRYYRMEERQGKSAALNFGLDVSQGEYLLFMDADSSLERGAIRHLLGYFSDPGVGAVAGDIGVRNQKRNLLTRLQAVEYLISLSLGRRFKAMVGILTIVAGAIGMFRRSLLERIGRLEPGPGNDSDLTIRIRKLGFRIAFAGESLCLTTVPAGMTRWLRQRLRWDRSVIRNKVRKHGDIFRPSRSNFSLSNYLAFLDTVFFTVLLPLLWVVYLIDVFIHYPGDYGFILLGVLIIHVVLNALRVILGMVVTERDFDWFDLLVIVPLFGFYRIVVKIVRIVAVSQEFLTRASYRDSFAPEKVRKNMRVY